MEQQTKVCKKCGIEKGLGEFYKIGKYYQSNCKNCHLEYAKSKLIFSYKNDKEYRESIKNKWAEYRKNNKEKLKIK